nr:UDP-N-acetylglucosamine 2-epimerase (non-hydrolyzing) [Burkholderiaceae bacterium]
PTAGAAASLRDEGVADAQIVQTGNTVIDALLSTAAQKPAPPSGFPRSGRTVLLTLHRRENFGANIRNALAAVRDFVDAHDDVSVWFPVHPNPNARDAARAVLNDHPRIHLVEPMGYRHLVATLSSCWCVLTDSGGLQEEAPALGRPVLVLRDRTERPEAVDAGVARLVGTSHTGVLAALESLYRDAALHARMARGALPYGDGRAATRIEQAMRQRLLPLHAARHADGARA